MVEGELGGTGDRLFPPVQFQPCKDPEDCPRQTVEGHTLIICSPEWPPIRSSGQLSLSKILALLPSCPTAPLRCTAWIFLLSYSTRQTWATDGIFSGSFLSPHNSSLYLCPLCASHPGFLPLSSSCRISASSRIHVQYTCFRPSFLTNQNLPLWCPLPFRNSLWGQLIINTREFSSVKLTEFFIMITSPCGVYAFKQGTSG